MELHETSLVLNYVFGSSHVLNPLRKRVGNEGMGTHIYFRNFGGKGYLARLGTIPSVMTFPTTVMALHTCYTLVSIVVSLLLLGKTFSQLGVLRSMLTFLGQFATKRPFALRLTSLGN